MVYSRPFLGGLPGAETGQPVSPPKGAFADPTRVEGGEIRVEHEDRTVELHAKTARHLMSHIALTLQDEEPELFLEQVLSEQTKQEFIERGYDPVKAYEFLKIREKDIAKLFARMPMGEYTPDVVMKKMGKGSYRVMVTGLKAKDMNWTYMDIVMEEGNWKLRWFG